MAGASAVPDGPRRAEPVRQGGPERIVAGDVHGEAGRHAVGDDDTAIVGAPVEQVGKQVRVRAFRRRRPSDRLDREDLRERGAEQTRRAGLDQRLQRRMARTDEPVALGGAQGPGEGGVADRHHRVERGGADADVEQGQAVPRADLAQRAAAGHGRPAGGQAEERAANAAAGAAARKIVGQGQDAVGEDDPDGAAGTAADRDVRAVVPRRRLAGHGMEFGESARNAHAERHAGPIPPAADQRAQLPGTDARPRVALHGASLDRPRSSL